MPYRQRSASQKEIYRPVFPWYTRLSGFNSRQTPRTRCRESCRCTRKNSPVNRINTRGMLIRLWPFLHPCFFIAFFTFSITSAGRTGILWADFAWSINFFNISLSVVPVISNEQSIPRSLHVIDTMSNPFASRRGNYRHAMKSSCACFKKPHRTMNQSWFPRLHVSGLILSRLFRLCHWTWCLSETSMLYHPLSGFSVRTVSWKAGCGGPDEREYGVMSVRIFPARFPVLMKK